MLAEVGLAPAYVPARTLVPLLDLAGLEDPEDEDMHARWAALLANASAGEAANGEVLPSFPRILSELTPIEATMLERLAAEDGPAGRRDGFDLDYFGEQFGFPRQTMGGPPRDPMFKVYIDNLARLRLCEITQPNAELNKLVKEVRGQNTPTGWPYPRIALTNLGKAFVAACSPLQIRSAWP
jgi:hypothetical protein